MPLKNHSPVWFGLLYPEPESAKTAPPGKNSVRFDFDYSSIYFFANNGTWQTNFDMELTQFTIDLRRGGLYWNLEAGVSQPFFYAGGGFMDDFILDYHRAFGFPDYAGQRAAPRNRYLYRVSNGQSTWNRPTPYSFSVGDGSLWLKKVFYKIDSFVASVKAVTQPPMASTTDGFGNGAWEHAFLLLVEKSFDIFELTFNAGIVRPGSINRGENRRLESYSIMHGAAQYNITNRLSFIAQGTVVTSPYSEPMPKKFLKTWRAVTFGFSYLTRAKRRISLGFLEDLSETGPDFTIHLSVGY
ncbi:MAG: DUF3187 family protein [Nitrospinota bacterium]